MKINIKLLKIQNQWRESGGLKYDPVLYNLAQTNCQYRPKILDEIHLQAGKISLIQGARGVGETTIMKMLIDELIRFKKAGNIRTAY